MQYKEGQEVCVSIENLYLKYRNAITYGHIRYDKNEGEYFDLFNEDGELACMDGEVCFINQIGTSLITFANYNGEKTLYFTLTKEETEAALLIAVEN